MAEVSTPSKVINHAEAKSCLHTNYLGSLGKHPNFFNVVLPDVRSLHFLKLFLMIMSGQSYATDAFLVKGHTWDLENEGEVLVELLCKGGVL